MRHPTPWGVSEYGGLRLVDANNEPIETNPYYLIGLVNSICAERDEFKDRASALRAALERLVGVAEEASLSMTNYPSARPTLASRTLDAIANARRVLGEVGR